MTMSADHKTSHTIKNQWVFTIKYIIGISQAINVIVALQCFAVETTAMYQTTKCCRPSSSSEGHRYHSYHSEAHDIWPCLPASPFTLFVQAWICIETWKIKVNQQYSGRAQNHCLAVHVIE